MRGELVEFPDAAADAKSSAIAQADARADAIIQAEPIGGQCHRVVRLRLSSKRQATKRSSLRMERRATPPAPSYRCWSTSRTAPRAALVVKAA